MTPLSPQIFPFHRENRALVVAVLGSIALHMSLMLLLPVLREAHHVESREPMVARLALPLPSSAPDASASLPPDATEDAPVADPAPRAPLRAKAKPAPKPIAAASKHLAIQAQPATVPDAVDAGTLAQYRLAVMSVARRHKRYPPIALENHWHGKVEIRMTIGADGSISSLAVRSSSGHALLDEQALEMIQRAQGAAPTPPALLGRQFVVDVPVEFALRESGT